MDAAPPRSSCRRTTASTAVTASAPPSVERTRETPRIASAGTGTPGASASDSAPPFSITLKNVK